jgi:YqcI/YcgG family
MNAAALQAGADQCAGGPRLAAGAARAGHRVSDEHSAALRRFDAIRLRTECLFATGARLWGSGEWPAGGLPAALAAFGDHLARLVVLPPDERPDGAVLEIPDPAAGATVERLGHTVKAVVGGLVAIDPASNGAAQLAIEDPRWTFTFAGETFFVVTFAPCYPADSSRHAFGLTATYVLLQARSSFVRRWAPGQTRLPDRSREEIRRRFATAGRPYDLAITLSPLEAHRFVKPDRPGTPPVCWWTAERRHDS